MNYVCAWCSKPLNAPAGPASTTEGTSHGICEDCSLTFVGIRRLRLEEILNRVSVPVIVMKHDLRVTGVNPAVAALLGQTPAAVTDRLPGEVIDCVGAGRSGGCGHSDICPACVFRRNVEATAKDGVARHGMVSRHRVRRGDLEKALQFRFSTAKVGDSVVANLDPWPASEADYVSCPLPETATYPDPGVAPALPSVVSSAA